MICGIVDEQNPKRSENDKNCLEMCLLEDKNSWRWQESTLWYLDLWEFPDKNFNEKNPNA